MEQVNNVRLDLSAKQENLNDAAAKIARQLNNRMPILRTLDPEITARALWLYDPDLCPNLAAALEGVQRVAALEEIQSVGKDDDGQRMC
jgi:hypothetical protein